jgi:hypothetical protein
MGRFPIPVQGARPNGALPDYLYRHQRWLHRGLEECALTDLAEIYQSSLHFATLTPLKASGGKENAIYSQAKVLLYPKRCRVESASTGKVVIPVS